jgi:hypothetical protein
VIAGETGGQFGSVARCQGRKQNPGLFNGFKPLDLGTFSFAFRVPFPVSSQRAVRGEGILGLDPHELPNLDLSSGKRPAVTFGGTHLPQALAGRDT